ncbi:MAG: hypothetical protein OEZ68_19490 [Gammaproteobacteria bacterium]|nr:hypothetical protein [Gammaproteobacteria bacterium]MDH5802993.1 hypothetical protein [Gammaproteobacteria bacterium]
MNNYEADFYCENCKKSGSVTCLLEGNTLCRCPDCGYDELDVWCDECEMGGYFVKDANNHPLTWQCEDCSNTYPISESVYANPSMVTYEAVEDS